MIKNIYDKLKKGWVLLTIPNDSDAFFVLLMVGPVSEDILVGLLDGSDHNDNHEGQSIRERIKGRIGYNEHDDSVDQKVKVGDATKLL